MALSHPLPAELRSLWLAFTQLDGRRALGLQSWGHHVDTRRQRCRVHLIATCHSIFALHRAMLSPSSSQHPASLAAGAGCHPGRSPPQPDQGAAAHIQLPPPLWLQACWKPSPAAIMVMQGNSLIECRFCMLKIESDRLPPCAYGRENHIQLIERLQQQKD